MSENQSEYKATEQPAAIIESPRNALALSECGLIDYQVWGWVKISAKFIAHIKRLKGAKLAVWQTMALSIDELGECELSAKELAVMTGYSRSEIIECQKELDEMGYLTVTRVSGKKNIYKPEFAARGESAPTTEPVQKNDQSRKTTSPVPPFEITADQSSLSIEKSAPFLNRVKRVNTAYNRGEQERPDAIQVLYDLETQSPAAQKMYKTDALLSRWSVAFLMKTTTKDWRKFAEYAIDMQTRNGWEPDKFIEWVKKQDGYPTFWSRKRMEENYPKAFAQEEKQQDWQDRSHPL